MNLEKDGMMFNVESHTVTFGYENSIVKDVSYFFLEDNNIDYHDICSYYNVEVIPQVRMNPNGLFIFGNVIIDV